MPNTHEWTITKCDYHDDNGCVKAVNMVHATLIASDGTYTTEGRNHTFPLGQPDPSAFTDFDSLTKAQLLSMVDADEKAEAEASADAALLDLAAAAAANTGKGIPAAIASGE